MPFEIQPGPVLNALSAIETSAFLYQLNTTDGLMKTNLWGGSLSVHNGNDPIYLQRAVKLFLAAEEMLAALQMVKNGMVWQRDNRPMFWDQSDDEALAEVEAAINKAEN